MNPIFRFIDWMLREHGAFVFGLFVYVAVPLAAWFFGRRAGRKKTKHIPTSTCFLASKAYRNEPLVFIGQ
jgi:hypothetical protein